MIIKAQHIAFETRDDIIDYVSKGITPTKNDFNHVIDKIKDPDLYMDCDPETLEAVLKRIYENRIYNRNKSIVTAAGIFVAGFLLGGKTSNKK